MPLAVAALAGRRLPRCVWVNEAGGLTFEVDDDPRVIVKWAPARSNLDLAAERVRLEWAVGYTKVPRVLGHGTDLEGEWLALSALPGRSAVDPRWVRAPRAAVRAIGRGLRQLHEELPVGDCPFSWSAEIRVAGARHRAARGRLEPARWHPVHRPLSVADALERIGRPPPVDRLVVCHGDPCAPNTLLTDDGAVSGHVDVGAMGAADRWSDLAVATWATEWNYGTGWEGELLDAYGVPEDPARSAYYRLLWDLGP